MSSKPILLATASAFSVVVSLWLTGLLVVELRWPGSSSPALERNKNIKKTDMNSINIPQSSNLSRRPPLLVATKGIQELIGNTPMVRINSLSDATGCEIFGKMELQNPGGSAKDRVALAIVEEAEKQELIAPNQGDMVFEGTSGSTGISLAMLCRAKGYIAHIVVPDDTSREKVDLLTNLGAIVHQVRPAGIVDPKQYVNFAKAAAMAINNDPNDPRRALFADQFENEANWKTHFMHTGPEIYEQISQISTTTEVKLDAFVAGAGTGGTISGVSRFLKEQIPGIKIVIADPPGSGFYNKVKFGVMFDIREKEGTRRRHQVDTVVEGIGLNRLTRNFNAGSSVIDDAIRVTDDESLKMAKFLVDHDGIFIGSSSAVNCVAAYRYAKQLGPGHIIVTILSDSGSRHLSKFWKLAQQQPSFDNLDNLDNLDSV